MSKKVSEPTVVGRSGRNFRGGAAPKGTADNPSVIPTAPSLDMSQVITHALNIKDDVAMAGYRDEDCLGAKTL